MKSCRKLDPLLSHYARGELEAARSAQVAAHLAICPRCRQEVATYESLARQLAQLPAPQPPAHVIQSLYPAVRAGVRPSARPRWQLPAWFVPRLPRPVLIGAALSLLLLLGVLVQQRMAPVTTPASSLTLNEMLRDRNWTVLYQKMSAEASRGELLDEPVPGYLLKTALRELVQAGRHDRRVRIGLQRIWRDLPPAPRYSRNPAGAPALLGRVSPRGLQLSPATPIPDWPGAAVLQTLEQLEENELMTLRQVLLRLS